MAKKSKKDKWFVPVRGSYLPNNWKGWLTYLPFMAYLVFAVVFAMQATDNHTQAVLLIIPNWIAATIVMTWLAKRTS
jgi:branched-subunit amino acid transport protein